MTTKLPLYVLGFLVLSLVVFATTFQRENLHNAGAVETLPSTQESIAANSAEESLDSAESVYEAKTKVKSELDQLARAESSEKKELEKKLYKLNEMLIFDYPNFGINTRMDALQENGELVASNGDLDATAVFCEKIQGASFGGSTAALVQNRLEEFQTLTRLYAAVHAQDREAAAALLPEIAAQALALPYGMQNLRPFVDACRKPLESFTPALFEEAKSEIRRVFLNSQHPYVANDRLLAPIVPSSPKTVSYYDSKFEYDEAKLVVPKNVTLDYLRNLEADLAALLNDIPDIPDSAEIQELRKRITAAQGLAALGKIEAAYALTRIAKKIMVPTRRWAPDCECYTRPEISKT